VGKTAPASTRILRCLSRLARPSSRLDFRGHLIGFRMHGQNGPPGRIGVILKCRVPLERRRRAASDAAFPGYAIDGRGPGEMGLEYLAVEIGFLRLRSLHRKTLGGSAHHAVRDFTLRGGLQPVDPAVSDAVGKLL